MKKVKVEETVRILASGLHSLEEVASKAGLLKEDYLTCRVCGRGVKDMHEHLKEMIRDKAHLDYEKKVEDSLYQLPCFCGGHIYSSGTRTGYCVECEDCGLIWDED